MKKYIKFNKITTTKTKHLLKSLKKSKATLAKVRVNKHFVKPVYL